MKKYFSEVLCRISDASVLPQDCDEPAEPGELGRIVVTDYYNKTFPMVRYDTGDTGMMRIDRDEKGRIHGKYVEICDRKEAIKYCMEHAGAGDIIILAGKGHEDYQEIKGVKHHMDERDLIQEIIEGR